MMKQNIATTPEQGKRLLACGLDPKSADFVWMEDEPNNPRLTLRTGIIEDNNPYIVAFGWSLSALLALLPIEINDKGLQTKMQLEPCFNEDEEDAPRWTVSYYDYYTDANLCYNEASDPIEACVRAIEWLTQNGYKLNEIKQ